MPEPPNPFLMPLPDMRDGDEQATDELWRRYFPQLARLAERWLRGKGARLRAFDGEDVAVSAMESFFEAVHQNRFVELRDEEDLLRLLRRITMRKASDWQRRVWAEGRPMEGESAFESSDSSLAGIDAVDGGGPTPELIAVMAEEVQRRFDRLGNPELQLIAQLRLEGYSSAEIAQQRNCSIATIERRLKMIRACWSRED